MENTLWASWKHLIHLVMCFWGPLSMQGLWNHPSCHLLYGAPAPFLLTACVTSVETWCITVYSECWILIQFVSSVSLAGIVTQTHRNTNLSCCADLEHQTQSVVQQIPKIRNVNEMEGRKTCFCCRNAWASVGTRKHRLRLWMHMHGHTETKLQALTHQRETHTVNKQQVQVLSVHSMAVIRCSRNHRFQIERPWRNSYSSSAYVKRKCAWKSGQGVGRIKQTADFTTEDHISLLLLLITRREKKAQYPKLWLTLSNCKHEVDWSGETLAGLPDEIQTVHMRLSSLYTVYGRMIIRL